MNSKEFFNLSVDSSEIEMDGKTYRVVGTDDRRGQVQLQLVCWYIDLFDYMDDHYDTEEEAGDALQELIDNLDRSDFDNDDEYEEKLDELKFADIESDTVGKMFWMHYKDINGSIEQ